MCGSEGSSKMSSVALSLPDPGCLALPPASDPGILASPLADPGGSVLPPLGPCYQFSFSPIRVVYIPNNY